jgi:hypothetical protein
MSNLLQAGLMLLSALLIIVADTIIKKVSLLGSIAHTLNQPLMYVAYVLYLIQIGIAVYIFKNGGELAIYTNLYIIFYSILGILSGVLIFSEHLSLVQGIGIIFALTGAILLNI